MYTAAPKNTMTAPEARPEPSRLLDAVPMANRAVRVEERGETLILFVPIQRRWWMKGPLTWALPFRPEKGIALDQLGTEVWRACDGERTVERIIDEFAERHRVRFHEARNSVVSFLHSLLQRKLLVLAVDDVAEAG
jgi:hypothetical protein